MKWLWGRKKGEMNWSTFHLAPWDCGAVGIDGRVKFHERNHVNWIRTMGIFIHPNKNQNHVTFTEWDYEGRGGCIRSGCSRGRVVAWYIVPNGNGRKMMECKWTWLRRNVTHLISSHSPYSNGRCATCNQVILFFLWTRWSVLDVSSGNICGIGVMKTKGTNMK